jgi:hypothetical protein
MWFGWSGNSISFLFCKNRLFGVCFVCGENFRIMTCLYFYHYFSWLCLILLAVAICFIQSNEDRIFVS